MKPIIRYHKIYEDGSYYYVLDGFENIKREEELSDSSPNEQSSYNIEYYMTNENELYISYYSYYEFEKHYRRSRQHIYLKIGDKISEDEFNWLVEKLNATHVDTSPYAEDIVRLESKIDNLTDKINEIYERISNYQKLS